MGDTRLRSRTGVRGFVLRFLLRNAKYKRRGFGISLKPVPTRWDAERGNLVFLAPVPYQ